MDYEELFKFLDMVKKIQKFKFKSTFLLSTFLLAFYMIFALNMLVVIVYLSEIINQIDFDTISISIRKGYYALNGKKIGIPIFYNFMSLILVWFLIIVHTLKSINKPIKYIFS